MRFASIIAAASLVASVFAQGRLAFTQTPPAATIGNPTVITWAGGDGSPVTITLKKGDPNNLETVAVLTGDAEGTSYTWTPSASLPLGDDYALAISQGQTSINYSGQFSLSGASTAGSTTILAVGESTTLALTTVASTTANATVTGSATLFPTTSLVGTGASASGTGITISRNTTFSSATLGSTTRRATLTSTAVETTEASNTEGAAATSAAASASSGAAVPGSQAPGVIGAGAALAMLFWL